MASQGQQAQAQQHQELQEEPAHPGLDHNYGPKCRLAPVAAPSVADEDDGMSPIRSQFFYSSVIPIDDPLSSGAIAGGSGSKSVKGSLRPFAPGDNNVLEKAWFGMICEQDRQAHRHLQRGGAVEPAASKTVADKLARLVRYLALRHRDKHEHFVPQDLAAPGSSGSGQGQPATPSPTCCEELYADVAAELRRAFCSLLRERESSLGADSVVQQVMMELLRLRAVSSKRRRSSSRHSSARRLPPANGPSTPRRPGTDVTAQSHSNEPDVADIAKARLGGGEELKSRRERSASQATASSRAPPAPATASVPVRPPAIDDGISGKPFIRVGGPDRVPSPIQYPFPRVEELTKDARSPNVEGEDESEDALSGYDDIPEHDSRSAAETSGEKEFAEVAVGISRLHKVSLPVLQMKPIYWSPINDLATVLRATWFYRDTMLPIPAVVANQLEAGYQELRPYSDTWRDELKCAVNVGPLGEEKVSHRLWPQDPECTNSTSALYAISDDQYCAAHCFRGEAAAEGSVEPLLPADSFAKQPSAPLKPFASYHVIYRNGTEAFLLKPSLKPSAYYGRRPVYRIVKGLTVGIPVVRGFDRAAWDRLYDKKTAKPAAAVSAPTSTGDHRNPSSPSPDDSARGTCAACKADKIKGQVTDLVLVAHGIGQKFAERVESFHFTHAINAFRRSINLELQKPAVREILRDGQNGIMVLPVNWRHTLSFEDGGPMREEDKKKSTASASSPSSPSASSPPPLRGGGGGGDTFTLKDIEPTTIPAVRSLISDVMFDIPFYMSHHKGKMIQALVAEANRVYRLWCRNNPGFAQNGRVHLIGHSLGSAMALEVLSKQPTLPPQIDWSLKSPDTSHFEFDTKNLFLAGSPAGFFLLLERGALVPRRGRRKPGVDPADAAARDAVGEAGTFGCLAVDNIYNVLAKEDPIAYLLNGTVDPVYSASLRTAYVPSTSVSLFKSVGDAVRSVVPGLAPAGGPSSSAGQSSSHPGYDSAYATGAAKPPPALRLPSQLELEVHDFSREEVAEKKAYLLNDNGQIDYFLRSAGGPLEIQYLNMLSAHSSYWTNNDFIRMLCMEIGRKPGRANTLPAMRAAKAAKRMIPVSN